MSARSGIGSLTGPVGPVNGPAINCYTVAPVGLVWPKDLTQQIQKKSVENLLRHFQPAPRSS